MSTPTSDGSCPACQRSIISPAARSFLDPSGTTVAGEVPCASCGYNLRTMAVEHRCPECGQPVARSLSADNLRFADLAWLQQVMNGIQKMRWWLAGFLAGPALFILMQLAGYRGDLDHGTSIILLYAVLTQGQCGLWFVGIRQICTEPPPPFDWPAVQMGRIAGLGVMVLTSGYWLLWMGIWSTQASFFAETKFLLRAVLLFPPLLYFCYVYASAVMLLHLRFLARQINRPRLATLTSVVLWLSIIIWGLCLPWIGLDLIYLCGLEQAFESFRSSNWLFNHIDLILMPLPFLLLTCYCVSWVLLHKQRNMLREILCFREGGSGGSGMQGVG